MAALLGGHSKSFIGFWQPWNLKGWITLGFVLEKNYLFCCCMILMPDKPSVPWRLLGWHHEGHRLCESHVCTHLSTQLSICLTVLLCWGYSLLGQVSQKRGIARSKSVEWTLAGGSKVTKVDGWVWVRVHFGISVRKWQASCLTDHLHYLLPHNSPDLCHCHECCLPKVGWICSLMSNLWHHHLLLGRWFCLSWCWLQPQITHQPYPFLIQSVKSRAAVMCERFFLSVGDLWWMWPNSLWARKNCLIVTSNDDDIVGDDVGIW